jgi:hypothetical protein
MALRSRDAEWRRAVILLLVLAQHLRDGAGPPHRPWAPPRSDRAAGGHAAWRATLAGRRPRG